MADINSFLWRIGVERPPFLTIHAGHGESLSLSFELYRAGEKITGISDYTATFYYKNDAWGEDQWYAKEGSINSYNIITVELDNNDDPGFDLYKFFIAVKKPGSTELSYRIHGELKYAMTPGFTPGSVTPVGDILDFDAFSEIRNFPIASNENTGGVKVGCNLSIDEDGVLSAVIPAQVNADWNSTSGVSQILNKPNLAELDYLPLSGGTLTGDLNISGANLSVDGVVTIGTRNPNNDIGGYSFANGKGVTAEAYYSHAEGEATETYGYASHAEGEGTTTGGDYSHTEGEGTTAEGNYSHAEGNGTTTGGNYSHAEGNGTTAGGYASHAEGNSTTADGDYSHAEGYGSYVALTGYASHAEGMNACASGYASHAEGNSTCANADYSHADGYASNTLSGDDYAFAWNGDTENYDSDNKYESHGAGTFNINPVGGTSGFYIGEDSLQTLLDNNAYTLSPATDSQLGGIKVGENLSITSDGTLSAVIPDQIQSDWDCTTVSDPAYIKNKPSLNFLPLSGGKLSDSLGIGNQTCISGCYSIAIGTCANATACNTFAQGYHVEANCEFAHAEGVQTIASGTAAHAEGWWTRAYSVGSHAEGMCTCACDRGSHSEGAYSEAIAYGSHAAGYKSRTESGHCYAFAWNGKETGGYYCSHGCGTFNINPVGGTEGFYIGECNLNQIIQAAVADAISNM